MTAFGKFLFQHLPQWLLPPEFADPEKTHASRAVYSILWMVMASITLVEASLAFIEPPRAGRAIFIILCVNFTCLAVFPLVRRGVPRMAGALLISLMWGVTTFLALSSGGIRSPAALAYFIIIFIAGITLGSKFGFLAALVCGASGFGLVWLEQHGWLVQTYTHTSFSYWTQYVSFIAIVSIVQYIIYRNIQQTQRISKQEMEQKLQAEQRFRLIFDSVNDAIFILDPQTREILEVNQRACEMFGYTPEAARQLTIDRLSSDEQQYTPDEFTRRLHQALNGESQLVEWKARDQSGRLFWVEVIVKLTDIGRQKSLLITVRDISERKQAGLALRESERKYRELFQVNKDGIAILLHSPDQKTTTFVDLNEAAHTMLGYTREEMLQIPPDQLEANVSPEKRLSRQTSLETQGIADYETSLIRKDGRRLEVEVTAQVVDFGGHSAVMNILRDITERKQHEQEVQAIARLSAAMRTAPTRSAMLPIIVEQLSKMLHCESATIQIIDPLTHEEVFEAAYGPMAPMVGTRQPPGTGLNAVINQTLKPYHNNNIAAEPRMIVQPGLREIIRAAAGTPLIVQEKLIGYIWMGRSTDISETEVRMLAAISDIAANAIHRSTLHDEAVQSTAELAASYDTTLEGWAHALDLRDHDTEGHTRRVVQLALDLAASMGISQDQMEDIRRGALLHDIGKMGIPDAILLKQGSLNDLEWAIMKRHAEYARDLLSPIEYLHKAMDIPLWHHEKWDGTGYPQGLKGEEIPLNARIFAIVDVWDALTSDRPYRKAWSNAQAIEYICEQSGRHFDPRVVERFLLLVKK